MYMHACSLQSLFGFLCYYGSGGGGMEVANLFSFSCRVGHHSKGAIFEVHHIDAMYITP